MAFDLHGGAFVGAAVVAHVHGCKGFEIYPTCDVIMGATVLHIFPDNALVVSCNTPALFLYVRENVTG